MKKGIIAIIVIICICVFASKFKNTDEYKDAISSYEENAKVNDSHDQESEDEEELQESDKKEKKKEKEKKKKKKKEKAEAEEETDGVTPSFKKTMDNYEAFFNEYADFMASVADGSSIEALANYADMMAKYTKYMAELEEIENNKDEMSKADLEYYIEVNARIQKKMVSVIPE